jgi:hypothetical protein
MLPTLESLLPEHILTLNPWDLDITTLTYTSSTELLTVNTEQETPTILTDTLTCMITTKGTLTEGESILVQWKTCIQAILYIKTDWLQWHLLLNFLTHMQEESMTLDPHIDQLPTTDSLHMRILSIEDGIIKDTLMDSEDIIQEDTIPVTS